MRADFYPRCAEHPRLRDLVAAQQFLVGPMGPAALRRAIEVPARRAGLELEPGLARRILDDVADRPGALPLLEYLLLELWSRRAGRELTLEAYAASGGVEGALARRRRRGLRRAHPERQAVARRIMLRLTQPGEGTEDTRRRAQRRELVAGPRARPTSTPSWRPSRRRGCSPPGRTRRPASPRSRSPTRRSSAAGPRLRGWIDEDREGLRLHRRLTEVADEWERSGRDDGLLYRGARLAEWAGRDAAASTRWSARSSTPAARGPTASARPAAGGRGSRSARWWPASRSSRCSRSSR